MMSYIYVALIFSSVVVTHVEAASADAECTNSLLSLINCEPFLAGTVANATETCCVGLGALVKTSPLCLCGVLAGNPAFSSVNLTRALLLPEQCDIPIDEGQCAAIGSPPPLSSTSPGNQNAPPAPEDQGSSASSFHWSSLASLAAGLATEQPKLVIM